jgi:hypothetical protein
MNSSLEMIIFRSQLLLEAAPKPMLLHQATHQNCTANHFTQILLRKCSDDKILWAFGPFILSFKFFVWRRFAFNQSEYFLGHSYCLYNVLMEGLSKISSTCKNMFLSTWQQINDDILGFHMWDKMSPQASASSYHSQHRGTPHDIMRCRCFHNVHLIYVCCTLPPCHIPS